MATVQSTLKLQDRMSSTFTSITRAMNSTLTMMKNIKGQNLGADFSKAAADIRLAEIEVNNFNSSLDRAGKEQDEFNNKIQNGNNLLDNMTGSVISLISAYAGFQGIKKVINLSDEYTQTNARLDLINDGLQTTEELQDKIFAAAQRSRAAYGAVSSSVAKLGLTAAKAFENNDEIIAFTELLNKNFIVGGASATEQAAAMYQLTQAMGSGKLQGDEYRSIIENAPLLAKAIEDYMRNVQGAKGTMKDWASEGLLTADVIKAALFSSADAINEKFESMPMTWGQVWTQIMNKIYKASMPVLKVVNLLARNWSVLEPIVIGLTTALGIYLGALLTYKILTGLAAISASAHAAATMLQSGETFTATAAQHGFNAALMACPLTWILLLILAVVAAFYAVVAAINKVTGSTISGTGVILGVLMSAVAFIYNLFLGLVDLVLGVVNILYDVWATFANAFSNVFNDPIGSIIQLFGGLADTVLSILQTIASAIDKIFGSNLAGTVSGWRDSLGSKVDEWTSKYGSGKYEEKYGPLNLTSESLGLSRMAYGDAYNVGYSAGAGLENKISNLFGGDALSDAIGDLTGSDASGSKALKTTTNDDLLSDDDIQLLLDVATRDYKLNYQQVTPQITLTFGDIHETADVDGLIDEVANRLEEIYDGNLEVE